MASLPPRPPVPHDRRPSPQRRRDDRERGYNPRLSDRRDSRDFEYRRRWDGPDDRRGPPPRGPPRRPPPDYIERDSSRERGRARIPPRSLYERSRPYDRYSPPPRRPRSPPPYRGGRPYSRSPIRSPRRYSRSCSPTRTPPRRHMLPTASPMRPQGRFRSRSPPRYPQLKRLKLGAHSIGSPIPARSPDRGRHRSLSRESYSRRSPSWKPREKPPPRDHDSPRDEGEIREYDSPERERPSPEEIRAQSIVRDHIHEESKPSRQSSPRLQLLSTESEVKNKIPSSQPSRDPSPHISISPASPVPSAPSNPPKPPIRPSSPPKHPRNWPDPQASSDSSPLFIPSSLRNKSRGRGGYRGSSYRGGSIPDAPRAPRQRGLNSLAQDHPEATLAHASLPTTTTPPRPSSQPTEPAYTSEMLLDLIDKELVVTKYIQADHATVERNKQMRDDYYAARHHSLKLSLEYHKILGDKRRALHEYEMAALELRHAQLRRQTSSKQHDLARLGLLGIDYERDQNGATMNIPG
ncbi:hypothetical protein D9757_001776 [Collybiopsis confluens]|uniref:Uncharacterized protein n=1 Tax=Collybiopsis confluens TaxID=2823264 RepID=A0A8H5MFA3_9AGAR|nr:hypothetical protein D9757_001776 [Collybiopsis confluens]